MTLNLNNCLFERTDLNCYAYDQNLFLEAYNNLFWSNNISLNPQLQNSTFLFRDNFFAGATVTKSAQVLPTYSHNAYYQGAPPFTPAGQGDVELNASFVFQTGSLGDYYQVSSDFNDAGSRSAAEAGLYHFTVSADNLKEGEEMPGTGAPPEQVDIGFHYVAVDPHTGQPVDTDSDGYPDYLGGPIIDVFPVYQIVLDGQSATFSAVEAEPNVPEVPETFTYQWSTPLGQEIPGATGPSLSLTGSRNPNNEGRYKVVVRNSVGPAVAFVRLVVLDQAAWDIWTHFQQTSVGKSTRLWSSSMYDPGSEFAWNQNCLLFGMKGFTAISQCNDSQGPAGQRPITALTKRHGYTGAHTITSQNPFVGFFDPNP